MSDSEFGACVVLIPTQNGLPNHVKGGHHITLAYLGDEQLEDVLELELLRIVGSIMDQPYGHISVETDGLDYFGDDGDAVVVRMVDHPESPAVMFRDMLLESFSSELQDVFKRSETFPDYKPHMTLGYKSEGFELPAALNIPSRLGIEGIAVWNGESRVLIRYRGRDDAMQYGILRKSGRYPWGSGDTPYQRSMAFYSAYNQLKAEGLSDVKIAEYFGEQATPQDKNFNTSALRATRSLAKDEKRAGDRATILRYKAKGMSNTAIAARLDMPEATVRSLMKDAVADRVNITKATADMIRSEISADHYIDVGKGTENRIGVSPDRLKTAVAILRDEGYNRYWVQIKQLGTSHTTNTMVLTPPDVTFPEVMKNTDRIRPLGVHSTDGGMTFEKPGPPKSVSSKKLAIRYAEDGGTLRDGLIEIRPGVKDLDLGANRYVQVRIAVDGTHYLKGMAVYADDLPDGANIRFNTNKSKAEAPGLKSLKELKTDKDGNLDLEAPFGAMIKPGGQRGALNIVNEEGDWDAWSKKLSSQMLSKQNESLAKQQLGLTFDTKKAELDEIASLTNPIVKQKLLQTFADNADAQAVTLKAMALPRTNNKVIMPVPEMKPTEVYAPTYKQGERVVLIRHPHGGTFEIPDLVVNNRQPNAKKMLGNARDAIAINPIVAEQLSGADFDGDTVLVIPQSSGNQKVKVSRPLKDLENFDPKTLYKGYEGMKVMSNTQRQMGEISNLITDMTIGGANEADIAAAVRHSMVVIDAEKHKLNYKQSYIDNGIARLKKIYQPEGGASTIISRAKSRIDVPERKLRDAKNGGPIDKETGELVFVPTGATYTKRVKNARTGEITEKVVKRTTTLKKMEAAKDARDLISVGTAPMEVIYADHANRMKGIANEARRVMVNTETPKRNKSAAEAYATEVASLNAQLDLALRNAPIERHAQVVGNAIVAAKMEARPDMDADDIKKVKSRALDEARIRTGAKKQQVRVSPREWEAIQAGAISPTKLKAILEHADLEVIREMATPRAKTEVTPAILSRAQSMLNRGYTQSEVAEALGISVSTLSKAL